MLFLLYMKRTRQIVTCICLAIHIPRKLRKRLIITHMGIGCNNQKGINAAFLSRIHVRFRYDSSPNLHPVCPHRATRILRVACQNTLPSISLRRTLRHPLTGNLCTNYARMNFLPHVYPFQHESETISSRALF